MAFRDTSDVRVHSAGDRVVETGRFVHTNVAAYQLQLQIGKIERFRVQGIDDADRQGQWYLNSNTTADDQDGWDGVVHMLSALLTNNATYEYVAYGKGR